MASGHALQQQAQTLHPRLKTLTNNDLKEICISEDLPVSGVKVAECSILDERTFLEQVVAGQDPDEESSSESEDEPGDAQGKSADAQETDAQETDLEFSDAAKDQPNMRIMIQHTAQIGHFTEITANQAFRSADRELEKQQAELDT